MDVATIIGAISSAIKVANAAVQLGRDATPFATAIYDAIGGKREITQADLDALAAQTDTLSAELQQPLPPEDPA